MKYKKEKAISRNAFSFSYFVGCRKANTRRCRLRKRCCDAHIDHHADDVIGDGDEGAGCDGRIYF